MIVRTAQSLMNRVYSAMNAFRADSTFHLMTNNQVGRSVWTPRNYQQFSREAYQLNVIAFRCIQMVSLGVASIPWTLFRVSSDGKREEIPNHPFLNLINRPNPYQDRYSYLSELIGFRLIAGNAYTEEVSPTTRRGAPPMELWNKRPDRMRVIPGSVGISAYEWRKDGGTPKLWPVDQVTGESSIRHFRTFHPLNDFYGMSPIEAAAQNIDQHNEADLWNMSLLKNSAAPSGALETDMPMGADEIERMLSQWRQRRQGSENAGNVVALTHGMKWKGLSMSPRDMLLLQSKAFSARFICLAFGVPPFLIGLAEGATFANFSEARLALWDETIVPLADHICQEFSNWLLPKFGENPAKLMVGLKLDDMPALELRRQSKWKRVTNAVISGTLTPNDARKQLGLPTVEGGDVLLIPLNAAQVGVEGDVSGTSEKMDELSNRLAAMEARMNGSTHDILPQPNDDDGGAYEH